MTDAANTGSALEAALPKGTTDVFISYSRKDTDFVRRLNEAIQAEQRDTWVDWASIAKGEKWWQEIQRGIEGTNTFAFVLSPDAVTSSVCRDEIDHAVQCKKRLVSIVFREGFAIADVHPALQEINWLFCRETDEFESALQSLLTTIDTDLAYVKLHTRLLQRAIEWDTKTHNPSFLLRGDDLEDAEQWLAQGTTKEPRPTELQGEYISTSRKTETARQKADRHKQRLFTAGIGAFALLSLGAAGFAFQKQQEAVAQRKEAEQEKTNADINFQSVAAQNLLTSNLELESLIAAIKTGQRVKQLEQSNSKMLQPDTRMRAIATLRQVVYGVQERNRLEGHSSSVTSVSFSPNGKTLATGSEDKTVKLWDVQAGRELHTLKGHSSSVTSVSFSPDGKTLATGSGDKTVKLWDLQAGRELHTLKGHSGDVTSVSFSPDGKTLATGSGDKTVKLWDLQAGRELQTLNGHSGWVWSVSFSPDGKTLATGSVDNTVKLWDLQAGRELHTLKGHSGRVLRVSFSPDGKTLATGGDDNTVELWDVQAGRELQTLPAERSANKGHSSDGLSVSFSPDGKTLATGGDDNTVKLWDVQAGRELQTLKGHSSGVYSVSFSPDGKTLATGSNDNTAKLWDVQTGRELQTLKGHSGDVWSVSFSPDGKTLATGGDDNTVKLWDVQAGRELQTLKGHSSWVWSVSFSPDGKTLATGSDDTTVKLWDVQAGRELQTLKGHSGDVWSVSFSPDGKTLATGSTDTTVKLWDVQAGRELQTLKGHSGYVDSVSFSPDGKTLATGSTDTTVKLWNLNLDDLLSKGCSWLDAYLSNNPEDLATLPVCQTPDNLIAASQAGVKIAEQQARLGNVDKATTILRTALKWNPNLGIQPEAKVQQFKALALAAQGDEFVGKRDIKAAMSAYTQAQALYPQSVSADTWNSLCWDGSLQGNAKLVLTACETAVKLAPKDVEIQDSRGLARALGGNTQGAIEDFQVFIAGTDNQQDKQQRQRWIASLRAGKNPFTPAELKSLENQ